jgi:hypothetical protein
MCGVTCILILATILLVTDAATPWTFMAMVWTNQGRRHGSGGPKVLNWATPIANEILPNLISITARVKVKKSWSEEEAAAA